MALTRATALLTGNDGTARQAGRGIVSGVLGERPTRAGRRLLRQARGRRDVDRECTSQ